MKRKTHFLFGVGEDDKLWTLAPLALGSKDQMENLKKELKPSLNHESGKIKKLVINSAPTNPTANEVLQRWSEYF